MDEHALSLNGHAVGVNDMADREYLASLNPVDMRGTRNRCPNGVPRRRRR